MGMAPIRRHGGHSYTFRLRPEVPMSDLSFLLLGLGFFAAAAALIAALGRL